MKKKLILLSSLVAASSLMPIINKSTIKEQSNFVFQIVGTIDTVDLSLAQGMDNKTVELPELAHQLNQLITTAQNFKIDSTSYSIQALVGNNPSTITWTNSDTENSLLQKLINQQGVNIKRTIIDISRLDDWNNIAIFWTELNSSEEFYAQIGTIDWGEHNRFDYFIEKINIKYDIFLYN